MRALVLVLLIGTAHAAPLTQAEVRAHALALLGTWVSTQNRGDLTGYLGLYDAAHFHGRKRTARGATDYDWKAWAADRTPMLRRKPTVAVDGTTIESWLDASSKLRRGVVRLRFLQRWKSARYADHGIKVLDLAFDPKSQELLIFHEELVNSMPGFDDAPTDAGTGALVIGTAREAPRALVDLKLTAGDVDAKLGAITDKSTRKVLAGAILDGDLQCTKIVDFEECGQQIIEWEPLEPTLAWPDPCVRRRAALWAVAQLEGPELKRVADKLEPTFGFGVAERELPAAILLRSKTADDALRLRFLRAAMTGKHGDLASAAVDGLGARALVIAANELHIAGAVALLDATHDRQAGLAALRDRDIDVATRADLLTRMMALRGRDVDEALRSLADNEDDCALSTAAAEQLAARGDTTHLPKRPSLTALGDALGHQLCRLVHDADPVRAQARWLEFLPPRGTFVIDESWAADGEDDHKPQSHKLTRKTSTLSDLPPDFGGTLECSSTECTAQSSAATSTMRFSGGYLVEISIQHWTGCGC